MTSKPFSIKRGVRQRDPISLKLFAAAIHEIFKKTITEELRIRIDGKIQNNLLFSDNVAILSTLTLDLTLQLNEKNKESTKSRDENSQGKNKVYDISE